MCRTHISGCDSERDLTVTEVIRRFAPAYVERYGDVMTLPQRKALTAILQCRTEAMGGRVCACEGCGATRYAGYSCGHSACSQCGSADTEAWVANQLGKLINVPYFMVTFTLPRELRRLMWRHAEVLYPAFFAVSSQCLRDQLACRENGLGAADSGFFGIMHTWTQLLRFHPHIHFIVPGVGFREDGRLSRVAKGDYLMPWEPLRDAFVVRFKTMLDSQGLLSACPPEVWEKDWRVNMQAFGNGQNAVKYLGAYVRKTAIGNSRIVAIDPDKDTVTFSYLDRADAGVRKEETVSGVAFVSRYMQHVFPRKFHRLRYYGYLHSRGKRRLWRLQTLTATPIVIDVRDSKDSAEPACPSCGKGMRVVDTFDRRWVSTALIDTIWGVKPRTRSNRPLIICRAGRAPPSVAV